MVYASDFEIECKEASPQGINPSILLVRAVVRERLSPMKGVMQPFQFKLPLREERWTSVHVSFVYDPEEGSERRIQAISADVDGL